MQKAAHKWCIIRRSRRTHPVAPIRQQGRATVIKPWCLARLRLVVPERAIRSKKKWRKCMGIEPTSPHGPKDAVFPEGGAESGALFGDDERLRVLLEAWPTLSKEIQQQIMLLLG